MTLLETSASLCEFPYDHFQTLDLLYSDLAFAIFTDTRPRQCTTAASTEVPHGVGLHL